jgi:outer membrane protein TolC
VAGPQDNRNPPPKEQVDESSRKVKELRKERIATLKELMDPATGAFRSARASYEEVLEAQSLLLQAELDAAEKESDRLAIYKQTIDALTESERRANARVQVGRGTQAAVLRIKARRLEVGIQLEQAEFKEVRERK